MDTPGRSFRAGGSLHWRRGDGPARCLAGSSRGLASAGDVVTCSFDGAPNMRVQRTRSSPSALRSPLTRHPLGPRTDSLAWRMIMMKSFAWLFLALASPALWAQSAGDVE